MTTDKNLTFRICRGRQLQRCITAQIHTIEDARMLASDRAMHAMVIRSGWEAARLAETAGREDFPGWRATVAAQVAGGGE